ncbi:hypothetical protein Rs2_04278 [Raphanus sativus]|nr:hypothetical protein Rs2_04278 [Raphanus sativus]
MGGHQIFGHLVAYCTKWRMEEHLLQIIKQVWCSSYLIGRWWLPGVEAPEAIGTLDESKYLLEKTSSSVKESIDVNGFQVLPSQGRNLLEDIMHELLTVEIRAKNQNLSTACMHELLAQS